MSIERRSSTKEVTSITDGTRNVEANRHNRFQKYDIGMLRMMGLDRELQELAGEYRGEHPDIEFRIIRPLILPEDINIDKYPDPDLRASFNLFFDFQHKKGDTVTNNIGRECSRIGLSVVRGNSFSPVALEVFGQTSEIFPLESVTTELLLESIGSAKRNPLVGIEPNVKDLDTVRPRILDVNPYSRKFVKHF